MSDAISPEVPTAAPVVNPRNRGGGKSGQRRRRRDENGELKYRLPKVVEKDRPRVEVSGTGMLRSMRHVMANGAIYDENQVDVSMRNWLEKEPIKFMAKLDELETREARMLESRMGKSGWGLEETDEAEQRALGLLERLLNDRESQ